MKSKKMALMNLFSQGSNRETNIENRPMDMGEGRREGGGMERVTWKFTM